MSQTKQAVLSGEQCPNCGSELPADTAKRTKVRRWWILCTLLLYGLAALSLAGHILFPSLRGMGFGFAMGIVIAASPIPLIFTLWMRDI